MKKQIKSLISLCLAVIVFLAAPIAAKPAYAAEENGISVSKRKVSAGETFNVTITVPVNTKRADTLSIRAEFDSSAFEVVEWEPPIAGASVTVEAIPAEKPTASIKPYAKFAASLTAVLAAIPTAN